jgi:hypothetical protein
MYDVYNIRVLLVELELLPEHLHSFPVLVQLLLNGLFDFYETSHICGTLPADVHEAIWLLS